MLNHDGEGRIHLFRTRTKHLIYVGFKLKIQLEVHIKNQPCGLPDFTVAWSASAPSLTLVKWSGPAPIRRLNDWLFNAAVMTLAEMERLPLIDMLPSRSTTISFLLDVWLMTTSATSITQVINQSCQPSSLTNHTQPDTLKTNGSSSVRQQTVSALCFTSVTSLWEFVLYVYLCVCGCHVRTDSFFSDMRFRTICDFQLKFSLRYEWNSRVQTYRNILYIYFTADTVSPLIH